MPVLIPRTCAFSKVPRHSQHIAPLRSAAWELVKANRPTTSSCILNKPVQPASLIHHCSTMQRSRRTFFVTLTSPNAPKCLSHPLRLRCRFSQGCSGESLTPRIKCPRYKVSRSSMPCTPQVQQMTHTLPHLHRYLDVSKMSNAPYSKPLPTRPDH